MENLCENGQSIKLLQSFPYSDIHCHETNRNTKFNYLDVQLNPTNSQVSQSPTICSSRTCLAFHQSQVDIVEDIAPIEYWCNRKKVSLQHVPDAAHSIQDMKDIGGTPYKATGTRLPTKLPQTAAPG